ncbi:ABC transporter ATP-binding protein [uncultured Agrococcus sp.]|uniref:ABC transporter ATP-binding protein n=1 Tax=uncultured Agrococcus sp. TaxID=382258 RepID=UPI002600CC5D|nr:ABC transporter ATP-binding protein [uncultured Agrococcus sp.]
MQESSEIPPHHENPEQNAENTLRLVVHRLLWILLAVAAGLNVVLNLLGHSAVAIVFGFVAIGVAFIIFLRFLRRKRRFPEEKAPMNSLAPSDHGHRHVERGHQHVRADVALRLNDVTKVFERGNSRTRALDAVTLDIPAGRFTSIVGPSGSGKSTLLHCAAAMDAPTSGTIHIGDTEVSGLSETRRTLLRRERIGFVFQSYNLVASLTVAQNITLPARFSGRPIDQDHLAQLIERVGLTGHLHHLPSQLSGGQQQRAAIVRALASKPDVVFADEPTGALDLRTASQVLDVLRELVDSLGQTVVLVTHDPSAAARAHNAVVMANGTITNVISEPSPEKVAHELLRQEAQ